MVEYKTPPNIQFPSFTICGCCLRQVIQDASTNDVVNAEENLLNKYSAQELINNVSYRPEHLINSCTVVMDSKKDVERLCTNVAPVLESIYDGRKCFTYLSKLDGVKEFDNIDNNDRYTAYINVELNFYLHPKKKQKQSYNSVDNTLQNANLVIAIHPPNMLPTMLDTEFYRIDPENMYEIQFTKEVTQLKERPYRTACRQYSETERPKSRNECVNLCIMENGLNNRDLHCIYYHHVLTSYMIDDYLNKSINRNRFSNSGDIRFCSSRDYTNYRDFTTVREMCYYECDRNCLEENYKTTIDVSIIDDDIFNHEKPNRSRLLEGRNAANFRKAMIIIWPNREMYQQVEHEPELNLFELIGCLGGHAHIWLGLSVIQFYDLFINAITKLRYCCELLAQQFRRFVAWCRRIWRPNKTKSIHLDTNNNAQQMSAPIPDPFRSFYRF